MKNPWLAIVALALAVAACSMAVIHYEGRQTREAMRELAKNEIPQGVREGINDSVGGTIGKVTDVGHMIDEVGSTIDKLSGGGGVDPQTGKPVPKLTQKAGQVATSVLDRLQDVVGSNPASASDPTSGTPLPKPGSPLPKPGTTPPGAGGVMDSVQSTIGGVLGGNVPHPESPVPVPNPPVSTPEMPKSEPKSDKSTETPDAKTSTGSGDTKPESSSTAGTSQPRPRDPVGELFDLGKRATRTGDAIGQKLFGLSIEEEKAWGAKLHKQILEEHKVVRSANITKRIAKITSPLLSQRQRREIEYKFTVIQSEDDDINAFSILGGFIYIHQALIDYVESDHELQFVLGHEIGHVDLGHCTQALTYQVRVSSVGTPIAGNIAGTLHSLLARPYTKDQEFEADAYGFRASIAAGQTREQALAFPRRFNQWIKEHYPEEAESEKPDGSVAGSLAQHVKSHFETHPPMAERIRRLEALDVSSSAKK